MVVVHYNMRNFIKGLNFKDVENTVIEHLVMIIELFSTSH